MTGKSLNSSRARNASRARLHYALSFSKTSLRARCQRREELEESLEVLVGLASRRGGKHLKKVWCCVGGKYNKTIWSYQLG